MSDSWDGAVCACACVTYGLVSWPCHEAQRWLEHNVRNIVSVVSILRMSCSRFSGDTIPDDNLILVGTGSTLLIHEASMGDDELGLAQAKSTRHSTFGQALDVGRR